MKLLNYFASTAIVTLAFLFTTNQAIAYQPDAAYIKLQEKNKMQWQKQDQAIQKKLAELEKKYGTKPNIIFILTDDIGWGELGVYLMGKLRGTPTPNLNKMAKNGMKFLQSYSEPSCTPSRIAILTGRHPVRTGLTGVLWPGMKIGLSPNETTIAELLKKAGYYTAMFGKWHLGELDKYGPTQQGFDYAYYGQFNGAAFSWMDVSKHYKQGTIAGNAFFFDFPDNYKQKYGIKMLGIFEATAGQKPKEVGKLSGPMMDQVEINSTQKIIQIIKEKSKAKVPFFIYWASYANQIAGSPLEQRSWNGVDSRNNQAAQMALHDQNVQKVLNALKEAGIAENTLVIWISDNGPMYAFYPNSGYTWLRGGKGEIYEGGVRVPGIAYWPGMIKPGQDPIDLIHLVDLFTTAATIAGVKDKIPSDQITDGINQLSLFLNGEGNGRRNYMFHYNGKKLAAIRLDEFKMLLKGPLDASIPEMEIYNIKRDPKEKYGHIYPYLFMITPFQNVIQEHMKMIKKFPHRKPKTE